MLMLLGFCALALLAVGGRAAFVLLRAAEMGRRTKAEQAHVLAERQLAEDVSREYAKRMLESRKLDLEQRALDMQEKRQRNPAAPPSIPSDLFRRIVKWESPDAQESERKILLDLYQEFRDSPDPWVEVRSHLPPEPSDEMSEAIFVDGMTS